MGKLWIYNHLPVSMQNYICNIEGRKLYTERMGGNFPLYLKEYLERKDWSYDQLSALRDQRLQKMIHHCYNTVPYYTRLFKQLKISPKDIQTLNDLQHLPVLMKDEVKTHWKEMLSNSYPVKGLLPGSTSGSTGTSLQFYLTKEHQQEQFALWWKYRIELGVELNMWCADFGSKTIVPVNQNRPPYWRTCDPLKQVKFSAFHGNPENYYHYYQEINKRKLQWIHGYPTCITPFAAFMIQHGLKFDTPIRFVTTGGENLYDFQRKQMFEAFGVYPYSHYGLGEAVANFSEDINHRLTVDEEFAAVEFIPNGSTYRIVGTSLSNYAMPLLRYDTCDLAVLNGKRQENGKRIVDFVDGRNGEYIRLKNGKTVGALSALFTETSSIIEAQLHQHKDFSVHISYVSTSPDNAIQADLNKVENLFRARVGNEVTLFFERVEKIPRTSHGKLRYIISDLNTQPEIEQGATIHP